MSFEESTAKRQCVEDDNASTDPSTVVARSNTQPSNDAPMTSFRDLIFSITGTMPASTRENLQMEQTTGQFSGKRKFNPNLNDCDVDASTKEKSAGEDGRKNLAGIVNESDVGITEFMNEHAGFSGILKQR